MAEVSLGDNQLNNLREDLQDKEMIQLAYLVVVAVLPLIKVTLPLLAASVANSKIPVKVSPKHQVSLEAVSSSNKTLVVCLEETLRSNLSKAKGYPVSQHQALVARQDPLVKGANLWVVALEANKRVFLVVDSKTHPQDCLAAVSSSSNRHHCLVEARTLVEALA